MNIKRVVLNRGLVKKLILAFILTFVSSVAKAADLELLGSLLNNNDAVCNSGSVATIYQSKNNAKKIFVYFEGGDVARSEQGFRQRSSKLKESPLKDRRKKKLKLGGGFKEIAESGYKIIYVPYCSSDLFMGNHSHLIDNKEVPFKGKIIFQSVFNDTALINEFSQADEIVLGGSSAGAIAIAANLDSLANFNPKDGIRLLLDSLWFDSFELAERSKIQENGFVHKTKPDGCALGLDCYPSETRLDKLNFKDAFIIWNLGDLYRLSKKDLEVTNELKETYKKFGSGISIGRNHNLKGALGDHHIVGTDAFYQEIEGKRLGDVIIAWLQNPSTNSFFVPSKSEPSEDIAKRLTISENVSANKPTVIIAGDGDCNGHETLSRNLSKNKYNWIYINHCHARVRPGDRLNRINYSSISNDKRVIDIIKTLEFLNQQDWAGDEVYVVGFAQGASAVNAIVDDVAIKRIAAKYNQPIEYVYRINAASSYYPFCQTQKIAKRPFIPHLVHLAAEDRFDEDFIGCEEKNSRSSNNLVIEVYDGAQHGFDREHYAGTKALIGRTLMGSTYVVEYDENSSKKSIEKLLAFFEQH